MTMRVPTGLGIRLVVKTGTPPLLAPDGIGGATMIATDYSQSIAYLGLPRLAVARADAGPALLVSAM